jgi:putative sigma-54 modulation protein
MKGKAKAAEFQGDGYKVHVTGRHLNVTEAMKAYAMEKVSKIEKFHQRILDVSVTMDVQKLDHRVDIVMKVDQIKIKSHAISTDMYVSIDKAVVRLEKQLNRYKERINDHNAKKLSVIDLLVNVFKRAEEEEILDVNLDIEDENQRRIASQFQPHEVVSTDTRPLKTLTLDEAVMKIELSGDIFLIYRGQEDNKLKVLYRRKDNNYGVIQVE